MEWRTKFGSKILHASSFGKGIRLVVTHPLKIYINYVVCFLLWYLILAAVITLQHFSRPTAPLTLCIPLVHGLTWHISLLTYRRISVCMLNTLNVFSFWLVCFALYLLFLNFLLHKLHGNCDPFSLFHLTSFRCRRCCCCCCRCCTKLYLFLH